MENGKMTRSMVSSETRETKRVGRGVFKLPDGAVCDGEWKDDKKNGKFGDARD